MKIINVKSLQKVTKTARFVWHIHDSFEPQNLISISNNGLEVSKHSFVFAHNGLMSFEDMYPYFIDRRFILPMYRIPLEKHYSYYHFWRIDTHLLDFDWYIDPNMGKDIELYCSKSAKPYNYICTPNAIPSKALTLFAYNHLRYIARKPKLTYFEGGVSIRPCRSDFDTLVPCKRINDII